MNVLLCSLLRRHRRRTFSNEKLRKCRWLHSAYTVMFQLTNFWTHNSGYRKLNLRVNIAYTLHSTTNALSSHLFISALGTFLKFYDPRWTNRDKVSTNNFNSRTSHLFSKNSYNIPLPRNMFGAFKVSKISGKTQKPSWHVNKLPPSAL